MNFNSTYSRIKELRIKLIAIPVQPGHRAVICAICKKKYFLTRALRVNLFYPLPVMSDSNRGNTVSAVLCVAKYFWSCTCLQKGAEESAPLSSLLNCPVPQWRRNFTHSFGCSLRMRHVEGIFGSFPPVSFPTKRESCLVVRNI